MNETPDLKALAERYLDLWEEQFAAAAADPALAAAMTAWLSPWRSFAAGAPRDDKACGGDAPASGASPSAHSGPAPRPAPAAPASGIGGSDLSELHERLARIERRLDALERGSEEKSKSGKPRGRSRSGTRSRRSAGAG